MVSAPYQHRALATRIDSDRPVRRGFAWLGVSSILMTPDDRQRGE
jgi:hypothetical protein